MKIVVKRKLPANYDERDKVFFQREFVKEIEEPASLAVRHAHITSQGIVYASFKVVEASLVSGPTNGIGTLHLIAQLVNKKKLKWTGTQTPAVVFDYWYKGYFHW